MIATAHFQPAHTCSCTVVEIARTPVLRFRKAPYTVLHIPAVVCLLALRCITMYLLSALQLVLAVMLMYFVLCVCMMM
jgi:hypothetical protein